MDFEPLQIRDSDPRTHGGPPGWIAFSVIFSMMILITLLAFVAGMLV